MTTLIIIKLIKAGTPKIDKDPTVIKLIGILRFSGATIILYAYSKKKLNIILFISTIIFLIIFSPINYMLLKKYY